MKNSFLFRKSASLYKRRNSKIVSSIASLFTSAYVFNWPKHFPNTPLQFPPSFDGRIVLYPSAQHVRDYFSWRQADSESFSSTCVILFKPNVEAHINNLYNTAFWALIQQGGSTTAEAHEVLRVSEKLKCCLVSIDQQSLPGNELVTETGTALQSVPDELQQAGSSIPEREHAFSRGRRNFRGYKEEEESGNHCHRPPLRYHQGRLLDPTPLDSRGLKPHIV